MHSGGWRWANETVAFGNRSDGVGGVANTGVDEIAATGENGKRFDNGIFVRSDNVRLSLCNALNNIIIIITHHVCVCVCVFVCWGGFMLSTLVVVFVSCTCFNSFINLELFCVAITIYI